MFEQQPFPMLSNTIFGCHRFLGLGTYADVVIRYYITSTIAVVGRLHENIHPCIHHWLIGRILFSLDSWSNPSDIDCFHGQSV